MNHRPHHSSFVTGLLAACALAAAACTDDETAPTTPELGRRAAAPAPSPLATVNAFGPTVTLWPFTGDDFGQSPKDPVNLIFAGQADARALRAAFLMLDGDRTAFGLPPVPPFDCTWSDNPNGDVQTAYSEPGGWMGSAIQIACGPYGPIRFHVRFFETGQGVVLGGAHFELLVPGTTTHQVLSWEAAKQIVIVDMMRTGLLDPSAPLMPSPVIHPAPWRDIPPVIYNELPVELRALIGGPLGNQTTPVPIITDGTATIFNVAGSVDGQPGVFRNEFTITFGQLVPKPFCASGPYDYLYVAGPINLREQVVLTPSGNLLAQFHALGHLDLTPIDPLTGEPTGEPYRALVSEHHRAMLTDRQNGATSFQLQIEIPPTGPFRGRLVMHLDVGPHGATSHSLDVTCTP